MHSLSPQAGLPGNYRLHRFVISVQFYIKYTSVYRANVIGSITGFYIICHTKKLSPGRCSRDDRPVAVHFQLLPRTLNYFFNIKAQFDAVLPTKARTHLGFFFSRKYAVQAFLIIQTRERASQRTSINFKTPEVYISPSFH